MRSFDKLNFFYIATGSMNKLKKMQQVSQSVNDHMLRYNTSLLLGDIQDRVKLLAETGQSKLRQVNEYSTIGISDGKSSWSSRI